MLPHESIKDEDFCRLDFDSKPKFYNMNMIASQWGAEQHTPICFIDLTKETQNITDYLQCNGDVQVLTCKTVFDWMTNVSFFDTEKTRKLLITGATTAICKSTICEVF